MKKIFRFRLKKKVKFEEVWGTPKLELLGDISHIQKGKTITESKTVKGNIPVIAGGQSPAYYHNESNRDGNIITVSASGAYAGFINYFDNSIFASDCNTIKSKNEKDISTNLIFHFLKSIQKEIYQLQRGQAQPHVYTDDLSKIKIPLPPIDIQQKIVAEIEELEKQEQKAVEGIEKLKNQIGGTIENLNTYDKVSLDKISENLDNLRRPVTKGDRENGKYPYYGASGIVDSVADYLIDDTVLLISEDGANLKSRVYPIAFTATGKIWVNNHAHILKFKEESTHRLVKLYINQLDISEFITGQAQPKLNQNKQLNNIKIPLPTIDEQKKIVTEIEKIEKKIAELENQIAEMPKLKEAILRKYLE